MYLSPYRFLQDDKATDPKLTVNLTPEPAPVPDHSVTLRRDINPRYKEVASAYETALAPARQTKPNQSPSTRRRQIQEALNAQVSTQAVSRHSKFNVRLSKLR